MSSLVSSSACPKILLVRRRADGALFVLTVPCESSRKCDKCARTRAKRLSSALRRLADEDALKVVFLTVTFAPSLGVSMRNIAAWRHRLFEHFRRRACEAEIPLNYVAVVERHKSGKPHLHVLLAWVTVRSARLVARAAVKGSHCVARLVRDDSVDTYLVKYVTKQGASLTSSRDVARRAALSVNRGIYELVDVKPAHMDIHAWLDALNVWWYDIGEDWQE
jgi:hypothetical protein